MTFYLKYRPQKISELDLDSVRGNLQKITASASIPHAFLFAGPKGAGKTSTARILAKFVNCESPKNGEPCNNCDQCMAITKGSSLDVIEIDAASHRGVDDIRALRETIKLAPAGSNKKVYIIDEAHMLTSEAANALLKTLEEPPAHVLFILATTASERLPDTIRSRTTLIPFSKGSPNEIARSLQKIVKGEKLEIEKDALGAIASGVDGSFREAHKILEQLAFEGKKITLDEVTRVLAGSTNTASKLLDLIIEKNTKGALEEIENLSQKGANLRSITIEMIGLLRKSMLGKIELGENVEDTLKLVELLSDAYQQIPIAVIPQLPLEMCVVKWAIEEKESHLTPQSKANLASNIQYSTSEAKKEIKTQTTDDTKVLMVNEELETHWREIMKQVKNKNHSVEALLRACKPAGFDGQSLNVEVFYKFHKDRLEQAAYRDLVEAVASEVLKTNSVRMICFLSKTKKKASDVVNITVNQDEDVAKLAEEIFGAPADGKVH